MGKEDGTKPKGMYWLMLLVPLFWGGAFATAKHVITEIPPLVAATIRFGIAGLLLALVVTVRKEWRWSEIASRWKGLLFIGAVGIFGYNALFFTALKYTSATNGALIIAAMPAFTLLGSVLLRKEAWNPRAGLGVALSLVGVIAVIVNGSLSALLSLRLNYGDLLFVAALVCGVLYGLTGKSILQGVPALPANAVMMLSGSVLLAAGTLFEGGWERAAAMSAKNWAEMIYMIVGGTLIGYLIFNKGVEVLGGNMASMYLNLTPIVATLMSVAVYGSTVTWEQAAGMAVVLAGVYLATSAPRRPGGKPSARLADMQ
ncbi:DMT family transporter [Paenibacillus dendritiformis]|uniref:DMT family transporter n=1 Tax=Paenibacillus dendritiformis TaxID=130049 RepID=UPI000DA82640|nr:DMT family transporter [Paenibacillus dendritiformis]PZM64969.1 EamA/RhaT family transporter [Paenibacillus dendritiformis]